MSELSQALLDRGQAGDPEAQHALGFAYARSGAFSRARRWFEKAAHQGHHGARTELAMHLLYGLQMDADPARACTQLEQAAGAGASAAAYQLAMLRIGDILLPFEPRLFARDLQQAVAGEIAPALRALALLGARAGLIGPAAALLQAHAQHDPLTQRLSAQLPASSSGYSWDALLATVEQLDRPIEPIVLQSAPLLQRLPDLLVPLEQHYLRLLAEPRLSPARVIDPLSGQPLQLDYRSNSATTLGPELNELGILLIERQLVRAAQGELRYAEPLSILRYQVGEEYRAHRDYFDPRAQPREFQPGQPGQRLRTVFCCLGEVAGGGATAFPRWGHTIPARAGQALVFDNVDNTGQPEPDSLHAGLPVSAGEKWLATIWLRERALRPW